MGGLGERAGLRLGIRQRGGQGGPVRGLGIPQRERYPVDAGDPGGDAGVDDRPGVLGAVDGDRDVPIDAESEALREVGIGLGRALIVRNAVRWVAIAVRATPARTSAAVSAAAIVLFCELARAA